MIETWNLKLETWIRLRLNLAKNLRRLNVAWLLLLATAMPLAAQLPSDSTFLSPLSTFLRTPAALTRYNQPNMAEAEVWMSHAKGGFTNFDGSPDVMQTGAAVESFYRFSPRTVFYGAISYQHFTGKDMAGSVFIPLSTLHSPLSSFISPLAPLRPFDIVEDSLTNTGEKQLDVYHLSGGFGTTVYKDIAVGARLDYTAANYAKYKDLRHQNKLMDLQASAGVYAPLTAWLNAGAHYQYHRNIESVSFSTYGKNDKTYKSLVDYGAFFGKLEQFGSQGYTDKSREMPMVDERHGGGLQFDATPTRWLVAYAGITLSHRAGYYGRKSPYTITYSDHDGDIVDVCGGLSVFLNRSAHHLEMAYSNEKLNNRASTFRELKNPSGATYYEYYDPVETAYKHRQATTMTYSVEFGCLQGASREQQRAWLFSASLHAERRAQTAYVYPYYRFQNLKTHEVSASLTRHLAFKHGIWSLTFGGSYREGSGEPAVDGSFVTPDSKMSFPPTMQTYLMREYQYLTSPQYTVGGSVKYTFPMPRMGLQPYMRVGLTHTKCNAATIHAEGRDRTVGTVALGCTF